MSFNRSIRSNPNINPEVDEPESLMRRADVPMESLYQMASASREILTQEAKIMDPWTKALEDHDGKDANNVDEDIEIKDEELELLHELVQTKEDPIQEFFTHVEVQAKITVEKEKSTSHCNGPVLAELVKRKLIDALHVGYDTAKQGVKNPLLNLVGEVTVDLSSRERWIPC